eukprot:1106564-Pyramimonas_sp.AAC.1
MAGRERHMFGARLASRCDCRVLSHTRLGGSPKLPHAGQAVRGRFQHPRRCHGSTSTIPPAFWSMQ